MPIASTEEVLGIDMLSFFYNTVRIHTSIGYGSPQQLEDKFFSAEEKTDTLTGTDNK